MEQDLNTDNSSCASLRPRPSGEEAVWMQERLTLRLTKVRREALLGIASVEGRILPPVEAIDRAIALASIFLRGTDVCHTEVTASRGVDAPVHTLSDILSDIPNPADAVSDIQTWGDGSTPIHVRHLADMAGTTRKMSDNEPQLLSAWLTFELERHCKSSAATAIVLARRALDSRGDGLDAGRLQCRLVAIDGIKIDWPGAVSVANWLECSEVVLAKPLQTKAAAQFLHGGDPHILWAERQQDGEWLIHIHGIGDTGVGSAVAVFSMSDTGVFGWQTLSAGTADI